MKRKTEKEILYQQQELLIEDSKNCMPGELAKNSQAMAKISKELFKHRCVTFVVLCFIGYLTKDFAVKIIKFRRR